MAEIPILNPDGTRDDAVERTVTGGRKVVRLGQPGPTTHDVQAGVEGVQIVGGSDRLRFTVKNPGGNPHEIAVRIADKVGLMPLLVFAHEASKGTRSEDLKGMAALYALIKDCVADDSEWQRFVEFCTETKADDEDLMRFVSDVIEAITARPTERPGGSSTTSPTTSPSSRVSTSGPSEEELAGLVKVSDLLAR